MQYIETALQVHHLPGVGKVARHLDIGPLEDAGTLAKVALFKGDLVGPRGSLKRISPCSAIQWAQFISSIIMRFCSL